jgi:hypothetical protein
LSDIDRRLSSGTSRVDLPYLASYAHTGLRPVHGPRRTRTGIFLSDQLPHRRLRVITMLRDIVDFRASNHAMIMCGLNYEVTRWNNMREASGLMRVCSPRDGLNISEMVDRKMADLMERCRTEKEMLARGESPKKKLYLQQVQQCADEERGIDTLAHCRSADHLLSSSQYDKHYRSMFHALMGRFHRDQQFTNGERGLVRIAIFANFIVLPEGELFLMSRFPLSDFARVCVRSLGLQPPPTRAWGTDSTGRNYRADIRYRRWKNTHCRTSAVWTRR